MGQREHTPASVKPVPTSAAPTRVRLDQLHPVAKPKGPAASTNPKPVLPPIGDTAWEGFASEKPSARPIWKTIAALVAVIAIMAGLAITLSVQKPAPVQGPTAREIARLIEEEPAGHRIIVLSSQPAIASGLLVAADRPVAVDARQITDLDGPQSNLAVWKRAITCTPPHLLMSEASDGKTDPLAKMLTDTAFADWFDRHYARVASRHARVFRTRLEQPPAAQCLAIPLRP
jgi:hypothetical protein